MIDRVEKSEVSAVGTTTSDDDGAGEAVFGSQGDLWVAANDDQVVHPDRHRLSIGGTCCDEGRCIGPSSTEREVLDVKEMGDEESRIGDLGRLVEHSAIIRTGGPLAA